MTDEQIQKYLRDREYKVCGTDFILDVSNTSPQIRDMNYDSNSQTMKITTDNNNIFVFKWILHKLS